MKRFKKYLTVVLFTVSVTGLLLSMAHYHSESMECLDHSPTEHHFSENTNVCPVCTLVADRSGNMQPVTHDDLSFSELIVHHEEQLVVKEFYTNDYSRPPPSTT